MESAPTHIDITMVDHEKEMDTQVADNFTAFDLPNEIILMIFRNLDFHQLLRASTVNHLWNELAFCLLQKRGVSLRLGPWALETPGSAWTRNRSYTTVSCQSTLGVGLDGADSTALQPLANHVREVELIGKKAVDAFLVAFLRYFERVETLVVKLEKIVRIKTPLWFLRQTQGILPSVRHLTLRCRYVRMVGLLTEVAPRLVTLDLELLPRLLPYFLESRFECLLTLTLRFKLASVCRTWEFPGKLELIQCLRQVTTLRKLGFYVDGDCTAFGVPLAVTWIEELALGGNFKGWPLANLENLSKLINLRSLSLDMEGVCLTFAEFATPLPTIEKLRISGPISIAIPTMIKLFPNLKILNMSTRISSDSEVQAIDGCSWKHSLEELTIQIASIKPNVTSSFVCLQKLKKLTVDCYLDDAEDDLTAFNAIASMDTLKELHIRQLEGMSWWKSAAVLGNYSRSCAVLINQRPPKFYGFARF